MPQEPEPSHIVASPGAMGPSDTLLAGGAISESWRVRSVLSQDGHDGISDEKTRISNSLWQDLQTYP